MKASIAFTPETTKRGRWKMPVITGSCGKPERSDEILIRYIDLNKHLIKNRRSTYGLTAYGESMQEAGIDTGDLLIVDRDAEPKDGDIVIVEVDGEFTVKRLSLVGKRLWLVPGNKAYKAVEVQYEQQCNTWGVVQFVIKKV